MNEWLSRKGRPFVFLIFDVGFWIFDDVMVGMANYWVGFDFAQSAKRVIMVGGDTYHGGENLAFIRFARIVRRPDRLDFRSDRLHLQGDRLHLRSERCDFSEESMLREGDSMLREGDSMLCEGDSMLRKGDSMLCEVVSIVREALYCN